MKLIFADYVCPRGCGFTVTVRDGRIDAVDSEGERYVVTGDDVYTMACELATTVGIDLEDG